MIEKNRMALLRAMVDELLVREMMETFSEIADPKLKERWTYLKRAVDYNDPVFEGIEELVHSDLNNKDFTVEAFGALAENG